VALKVCTFFSRLQISHFLGFFLRVSNDILGRSDFGVDLDTVDTDPIPKAPGLDKFELERSRQFAYWLRNVHNIRLFTESYHKTKKQSNWGSNPKFVGNNPLFNDWLANLPPDLQVCYPQDGSAPWLPSHFLGNMHSHFHLAIIMLHRPQLLASKPFAAGGAWKTHMSLCYSSAKTLCRLQESILASFGLSGLLYMQRGINFTIYSILTCTMLHLVSHGGINSLFLPLSYISAQPCL
jgi:hypothetical protein